MTLNMPLSTQLLGALLLERGLVTENDLERAIAAQPTLKARLGAVLVRLGAISEDNLLPVLADQTGLMLADEHELPVSGSEIAILAIEHKIAQSWLSEFGVLLWRRRDGGLGVGSRHPLDVYVQEVIERALNQKSYQWFFVRTRDISRLISDMTAGDSHSASNDEAHLKELAEEAPVIELVNNIFAMATDEGASDIHVEPNEGDFEVRYRIDGVLQSRGRFPKERTDAVTSRIKLISGLDIAERRLPQDGRISLRTSGMDMDVRVSVIPGVYGESIVMRLLPKERKDFSLKRLGMERDHLEAFERYIKEPHGIVLVTGPTGSGKSTTLYTALAAANDRSHKIITVEDPVEFKMHGITQIQTHAEIGYDFSRALRAILRHDPDIIMIGEIRDLETAEIAVQSALTGHMVFSTLHTNDAVSAFTRLMDMGVEPFLVASSVRAVQAQRLVRRICQHCAEPVVIPDSILARYQSLEQVVVDVSIDAPRFLKAHGCAECNHTGYKGRLGIYEFVEVTPRLQEAIMLRQSSGEVLSIARAEGNRSLFDDGLLKASRGLTSLDEVLRVTGLETLGEEA
ncbi:Flp pilus assembly complex ATPase component TadA [Burkholderiaceae bacterium DAT-1]|nr:Flp pilus assembly complex ATPase component TadA [Burkholderiaceae bacterium DAT-1]